MAYSVDQIVTVTTRFIPGGLSTANFGFACLFSPQSEGGTADNYIDVNSASQLLDDYGYASDSETYIAANKWLGSSPSTRQLRVYTVASADASYVDSLAKARAQFWWFITLATVDLYDNVADVLQVAEWCNSEEIYFPSPTRDATALSPGNETSLPYQLTQQGYRYCHSTYHATDPYSAFPILSWFAVVNYESQKSTITGEYKTITNVASSNLTPTEYNALEGDDVKCGFITDIDLQGESVNNRYINAITHSANHEHIDSVFGTAAFINSVKTAIFNLIANQATKVPQNVAGQAAVITTAEAVCEQYIQNGFLGERFYVNPDTGMEEYTRGYQMLTKPEDILSISDSDRTDRLSAPIEIRIFRAGAIEEVFVDLVIY